MGLDSKRWIIVNFRFKKIPRFSLSLVFALPQLRFLRYKNFQKALIKSRILVDNGE